MGAPRFTPEFKQEAIKQVTERGYSVPDVAARVDWSAGHLPNDGSVDCPQLKHL